MPNLVVVPAYTQVLPGRNSKKSSSHTDRTGHIKYHDNTLRYVRKYVYDPPVSDFSGCKIGRTGAALFSSDRTAVMCASGRKPQPPKLRC